MKSKSLGSCVDMALASHVHITKSTVLALFTHTILFLQHGGTVYCKHVNTTYVRTYMYVLSSNTAGCTSCQPHQRWRDGEWQLQCCSNAILGAHILHTVFQTEHLRAMVSPNWQSRVNPIRCGLTQLIQLCKLV